MQADASYDSGQVHFRGTSGTGSVFSPAGNKVQVLCQEFRFMSPVLQIEDSGQSWVLVYWRVRGRLQAHIFYA